MVTFVKNSIAVLAGLVLGSAVNMAIITISGYIIPPPAGADVTTMEGLKESLHLFEPQHFIMPFLAHALGTFSGALLAAIIAPKNKMRFALAIGFFFLVGGIANVLLLPSPIWFTALDIILAYIPIAYLAGYLITRNHKAELLYA
jgi:hypothetical protein